MSSADFELFLSGSMALCAVLALLTLLRIRSRGLAALLLSGAFLAFGATLYLLKTAAPQPLFIAAAVLTGVLLVADFAVRAGQQEEKKGR